MSSHDYFLLLKFADDSGGEVNFIFWTFSFQVFLFGSVNEL